MFTGPARGLCQQSVGKLRRPSVKGSEGMRSKEISNEKKIGRTLREPGIQDPSVRNKSTLAGLKPLFVHWLGRCGLTNLHDFGFCDIIWMRRTMTTTSSVLILAALATLVRGQTSSESSPVFEVSSVKPSSKGSGAHRPTVDPSLLSVKGMTLQGLIMLAYDVPPTDAYRVTGGPEWAETDLYDVDARPATPSSRANMQLMLRSLLADRFHLSIHWETKDVVMDVLAPARGGPKFGPQFHAMKDGDPPPDLGKFSLGNMAYPGITIGDFLNRLRIAMTRDPLTGTYVGTQDVRPLLDGTGLTGRYVIVLKADSEESWTAMLERQLGLKLDQRKVPVEIIAIDSVAKPAGN
jgi:uncharacterized protein (TIGR03435 family)